MKIIDYKLVLCNEVKDELKKGWELYGIPFSVNKDIVGYEQAFQAMILKEKDMKCINGVHFFDASQEELANPQYYNNEIMKITCKECGILNIDYMKSIFVDVDAATPNAMAFTYRKA